MGAPQFPLPALSSTSETQGPRVPRRVEAGVWPGRGGDLSAQICLLSTPPPPPGPWSQRPQRPQRPQDTGSGEGCPQAGAPGPRGQQSQAPPDKQPLLLISLPAGTPASHGCTSCSVPRGGRDPRGPQPASAPKPSPGMDEASLFQSGRFLGPHLAQGGSSGSKEASRGPEPVPT